jgi:aryl-alcohol dehydrogenase-like predicted oxidoreductase
MRELGIGLVAYSPLGRGLLTGAFRTAADLPADDARRRRYPRYSEDNLQHNLDLTAALYSLADEHGVTPPTLALAWVLSQGEDIVPIPGTRRPENLVANVEAAHLRLSADLKAELEALVPKGAARGDRYNEPMARRLDR